MIPAKKQETPAPSTIEAVLMKGDLSALSQEQRLDYYNQVCKSLGLNPLTRPFDYLTLNGKLTLYARRDAADQLRKINGISVEIVSQEFAHGLLTIHVRAKDRDGRTDEDLGVVAFPEALKGDAAANAILKAVTKAKRRVTLSLSGLGFLDETEVEDIPAPAKQTYREPESGPQPTIAPARKGPTPEEVTAQQKRDAKILQEQRQSVPSTPHKLPVPHLANNAGPDYRGFAMQLLDTMRGCPEMAAIFEWQQENQSIIDEMQKHVPMMHKNLVKAIEDITSAAT